MVLVADVAVDAELLRAVALVVAALAVVLLAEASAVVGLLVVSVGAVVRLAGVDPVASAEVADVDASKWALEWLSNFKASSRVTLGVCFLESYV